VCRIAGSTARALLWLPPRWCASRGAGACGDQGQPVIETVPVVGAAAVAWGLLGFKTGHRRLTCGFASGGGRLAGRIAGL
jgi:hypothetical protein